MKRVVSIAAASLFALLTAACTDRMAGNGSEVENAVVLGRVVLPDGEPAAGVRIQLLPEGHDPRKHAAPGGSSVGVTGKDGSFRLGSKAGAYNVYAVHGKGFRLLLTGLDLKERTEHQAGSRRMDEPGSIRMALPARAKAGDYVYLPGTPLAAAVDSSGIRSGFVQVDSVPAGRISKVVLAAADTVSGLGSDVAVAARGLTELPYTAWKHEGVISIRVRDVAGGIAERVTGIPLLVRLDAANFDFTESNRPSGGDLRFTRDDGKPLPWHVQSWDAAGSRARIWVRLDTVFAESTEQKFRMYWGAPDTAKVPAPGASKVFAAAEGWVGAWHLDALPQGSPASFPSAGTGPRAFAQGALATADSAAAPDTGVGVHPAHGIIGSGVHLNGSNALLALDDTVTTPQSMTLSFWFRTTTKEGGKLAGFVMPGIQGKVDTLAGNFNFDRVLWMDDAGILRFGFTMAAQGQPGVLGSWKSFESAAALNDGEWHHVGLSLSDRAFHLYVDGVQVVSYAGPIRSLSERGFWRLGYVGDGKWSPGWTSEYFRGSLDEVRLIHSSRAAEWLRLDQVSQDPGAGLLRLDRH